MPTNCTGLNLIPIRVNQFIYIFLFLSTYKVAIFLPPIPLRAGPRDKKGPPKGGYKYGLFCHFYTLFINSVKIFLKFIEYLH